MCTVDSLLQMLPRSSCNGRVLANSIAFECRLLKSSADQSSDLAFGDTAGQEEAMPIRSMPQLDSCQLPSLFKQISKNPHASCMQAGSCSVTLWTNSRQNIVATRVGAAKIIGVLTIPDYGLR